MEQTTITKISTFLDSIFRPVMMKIVVALLILLVSFIIGRLLGKTIEKILGSFKVNKTFYRTTGMAVQLEQGIGNIVTYAIGFLGIIFALNELDIALIVAKIILAVLLAFLFLYAFLWLKDLLPNLLAGMKIRRNEMMAEGDRIIVYGLEGEIKKLSLLEARMRTKQGELVFIPNSIFMRKKFRIV
jgi:small-conductance mechanosensitive channel